MLTFTKEQLSEVMCEHAEKENGLHDLLEIPSWPKTDEICVKQPD